MKKSLLALAVSLVALSSGAHAAWDAGGTTDGEALLMVMDLQAKTSYVQDLNVKYSDFYSGAAFTGSPIALYSAGLTSIFGANYATNSNLQWGVVVSGGDANTPNTWGLVQSVNAPLEIINDAGALAGQIGPANSTVGGWNTGVIFTSMPNGYITGSAASAASSYAAQDGVFGYISAYGYTQRFGSGSLNLWLQGFNADYSETVEKNAGPVTVDFAANTLTFGTPVSNVPVPGAAWLLGSALVGLSGVARTRKSA